MKATGEQGARAAWRRGEAREESDPAMRELPYETADDMEARDGEGAEVGTSRRGFRAEGPAGH